MKYIVPAFLAISLLMTACKNNPPKNTSTPAISAKDSAAAQQSFFPVPDYIGGQVKIIDSLQLPLMMSVILNRKEKTSIISGKELHAWARNFREPDITGGTLMKFYKETSIADQSIPSVTLIYTATDNKLTVQKINVYIKPDPVENDKVTGIYIEKAFSRNDTLFNQKLYWKTGKNMQVITEKKINGTMLPVEQVKITWDPSS